MIGPKGPLEKSELRSRERLNVTSMIHSKLPKRNATWNFFCIVLVDG